MDWWCANEWCTFVVSIMCGAEFFLMAWELFVSSSSVSQFWPWRNGVVSQMAATGGLLPGGECLLWWFSWLWWCTSWCTSRAGWAALPSGTLSTVDHFVESFPVHIGAATVLGVVLPVCTDLTAVVWKGLCSCGDLKFLQQSEVLWVLACLLVLEVMGWRSTF